MKFARAYTGLDICFAAVVVFAGFGLAVRAGNYFYISGEVVYAARLALSAKLSLMNGDFPLRYANDYEIALQPLFLFYTPVSYGIAGALQVLIGISPYTAILIVIAMCALSATLGIYAAAREMGADSIPSGLAAAALPFSPYFLTDVFARAALAELSAWALLPWVTLFFVRFCRQTTFGAAVGLILTTALFILCHKIFFAWTLVLLAIFGLSSFGFYRMLALAPVLSLCLLAAMTLTAPYWANAMLVQSKLPILSGVSVSWKYLTSDLNVLWPLTYTYPSLVGQYGNFSLQTGPVVTAALVGGFCFWRIPVVRSMLVVTIIALLFACSFFSSADFWQYMPKTLSIIQFPYRLLVLVTTFGLILAALVLSSFLGPARRAACHVYVVLAVFLLAGFWWVAPRSGFQVVNVGIIRMAADANNERSYFETDSPVKPAPPADLLVPAPADIVTAANSVTLSIVSGVSRTVTLPVQFSTYVTATINGEPVPVRNSSGLVGVTLPEGSAQVRIRRSDPVMFYQGAMAAAVLIAVIYLLLRWQAGRAGLRRTGFSKRASGQIIDGAI